jgi:hypothetical protein
VSFGADVLGAPPVTLQCAGQIADRLCVRLQRLDFGGQADTAEQQLGDRGIQVIADGRGRFVDQLAEKCVLQFLKREFDDRLGRGHLKRKFALGDPQCHQASPCVATTSAANAIAAPITTSFCVLTATAATSNASAKSFIGPRRAINVPWWRSQLFATVRKKTDWLESDNCATEVLDNLDISVISAAKARKSPAQPVS